MPLEPPDPGRPRRRPRGRAAALARATAALLAWAGATNGALAQADPSEALLCVAPTPSPAMCLASGPISPAWASADEAAPPSEGPRSSLIADRLELADVEATLARWAQHRNEAPLSARDPSSCALERALASPSSPVVARARVLRVRCLLLTDDPSAGAQLEALLRLYPELPDALSLRLEAGAAELRAGRRASAALALRAIDLEAPGSHEARRARELLASLRDAGVAVAPLSPREEVDRAGRLVRAGPPALASAELARLREAELPALLAAQVLVYSSRVARAEARFDEADRFDRAARELDPRLAQGAREPLSTPTALDVSQGLRALRLEALVDEAATAPARTRALRGASAARLLDAMRIVSRASLGPAATALVIEATRRTSVPCATRFELAVLGSGTASGDALVPLLERCVDDGAYGLRARYLRARALERMGRGDDAIDAYRDVVARDQGSTGFYALWAGQRLVALGAPLPAPTPPSASRSDGETMSAEDAIASLDELASRHGASYPWLERARELVARGDRAGAREELHELYIAWLDARGRGSVRAGVEAVYRGASRERANVSPALRRARRALEGADLASLARVSLALGEVGLAIRFGGVVRASDRPRAFEDVVLGAASRHGLDPNLLFAVMRVESVYDPEIVSYAGAIGLLQIMPRTGRLIAERLGIPGFRTDDLLDPAVNVELAAWYLRSLLDRFEGRLPLAIAAYNGGPHNVRRWMQGYASEMPLDAFLERIPFEQTFRYVRRVLSHYAAYRANEGLAMPLLDATLPPRASDPVAF